LKLLLPIVIAGAFSLCLPLSRADSDPYPAAHPPAGIQPKLPANYVPYKYPYSPQELLKMDGAKMQKLAEQAWAEIGKVNAEGAYANTYESLAKHDCPEWFKDAKIGMFIDWGPWSVAGYAPPAPAAAYPDWYEWRTQKWAGLATDSKGLLARAFSDYHQQTWGMDITDDDLINLLSDRNFNPEQFARLAKACGFRYVVPFLKHHGGFSMWDSSFTRRNSMAWAFHRDFAQELRKACQAQGLKFGVYVSLGEWNYPAILPNGQVGAFGLNGELMKMADPRQLPAQAPTQERADGLFSYLTTLDQCRFLSGKVPVKDYVRDYLIPATKELIDKTKPDLIWYDGEWLNGSSFWHTRDLDAYYYNRAVRGGQEVCINDRWGEDARKGQSPQLKADFATSEFGGGTNARSDAWEETRSFSHNFGYNWTEESDANAILSDKACIDLLVDVVGRGGNLLLIVSPTGTGEIPPRQLHAIGNMGDWLKKFGAAIYGTRAYAIKEQPRWGRITRSKDGGMVYLLVTKWPADGRLEVPHLAIPGIESAAVMEGQGQPGYCQPGPDGFTVDLSACTPGDPRVSVIALKVNVNKTL
jgi:alpha-L-fucosidase